MAISLTTGGLSLDYRTTNQMSVSGTYPIGTVIVTGSLENDTTFPGTWAIIPGNGNSAYIGNTVWGHTGTAFAIRLK